MNPISILVVEDVVENREVMAVCLRSRGHDVTTAAGGREAIAIMSAHTFDLIITDMLMPDGDGVQVLTAARRVQPLAGLVAMTGGGAYFSSQNMLHVARTLGADAHLLKPFTQAELFAAIAAVCSKRAARDRAPGVTAS